MDISGLSNLLINQNSQQLLPATLFDRLAQQGPIQASVASISKGQAVLTSQLGQILTANTLDLKVGDQLSIRSDSNSHRPTLKVSLLPQQPITLNRSNNKSLASIFVSARQVTAVVVNQGKSNTIIKAGNQRIKIQPLPELKIGQLVSLTKSSKSEGIEVRPVNHEQLLKSAVGRLIPQRISSKGPAALVQVVNLIHAFVRPGSGTAMQFVNPALNHSSGNAALPSIKKNLSGNLLETLIRSIPETSKIDRATIRQWIGYIINPGQDKIDQPPLTQNPYRLIESLAKSETAITQQLKQLIATSKQKTIANPDQVSKTGVDDEVFQMVGRDLIKLSEQSLGQKLFQQSSLRLQQEQQQPLLLHLAIPLNDQEKLTELGLKIQQRKSESDPENQIWDIRLDFEIGSLGKIATHLSLSGNTVSASFWSGKTETQKKIESGMDDFQIQISSAGFTLGQFHSFHGKPPQDNSGDEHEMPEALLDIRV